MVGVLSKHHDANLIWVAGAERTKSKMLRRIGWFRHNRDMDTG